MRFVACLSATLFLAAGLSAQRSKKANDPDVKEIRDYRLTMDAVQKYVHSAEAVGKDPVAKKCFDHDSPGNAASLDAGEKMLNACPAAVSQLTAAHLKPREFLIITAALIGDIMAVGMKKNGTIKEYPASISPENASFVEQNYDKLTKLLAAMSGSEK